MPQFDVTVPHLQSQQDAQQRLESFSTKVKEHYAEMVKDVDQQWEDNVLHFGFKTMGVQIKGDLTVNEKDIRVGVDVYQDQPAQKHCEWSTRLAEIPGAALTHHCGASTDQAQSAVAEEVVEIVRALIETGTPRHIVNASALAESNAHPAANR